VGVLDRKQAKWRWRSRGSYCGFADDLARFDLGDGHGSSLLADITSCPALNRLGVITDEVGVGKGSRCAPPAPQLDPSAQRSCTWPRLCTFGTRWLYLTIVNALGARPGARKAERIAQAQTLLAAEEHERRRRVVVLIEAAHLLAPVQLEELRLLTNAERGILRVRSRCSWLASQRSPVNCGWSCLPPSPVHPLQIGATGAARVRPVAEP
jgi:type II secretory pathway predicted ATPase ExeA